MCKLLAYNSLLEFAVEFIVSELEPRGFIVNGVGGGYINSYCSTNMEQRARRDILEGKQADSEQERSSLCIELKVTKRSP
jgi:hypothetical protein